MKPSDLKKLVTATFQAGIQGGLHVESAPGLGKTAIPAQVAAELGIGFKTIHAPLLQPEDYGFPVVANDKSDVGFVVSRSKFPMENSECPETGILLLDELSQADPNQQKILANLIQEREIHGLRLKKGWQIISTGNRTTDRAGANRLLTHLANRLTRVELEVSLEDWKTWALANGVKPEVIAFINFRPALLSDFNPQSEVNATPRAWAQRVSAYLGKIDATLEFETFKGSVGEGPAAEFLAFLKIFRNLPDIDGIIAGKVSKVPKDPATLYALCGALSHRVTKANFDKVMAYVNGMPNEFSVLFVRDAIKIEPQIQTTKAFITWATTHGKALLA